MSTEPAWRRELHRIRDEHRSAMARATEQVQRAQTPTVVRGQHDSVVPEQVGPDPVAPRGASVLLPANVDRREPTPPIETEPDERRRSWLV